MKIIKLFISIMLLTLVNKGFSQCTQVCVVGTSTSTINPRTTYTASTTYTFVTTAGSHTITAGALSISISNVGTTAAQLNGQTLPAGASLNIQIPNAVLPSVTYDCLTSSLMVLYNR